MSFSPVEASKSITNKYCKYLKTAFKIGAPYKIEFDQLVSNSESFAKGPYLEVTDAFVKGKTINELIEEQVLPKSFDRIGMNLDRPLYKHQENAIRKIAMEGRNLVVSTGTGSGKTESFLIPVLRELVNEYEKGTLNPGVRALLIYPMNALANDQTERLRSLLSEFPEITFGVYTGQTEQRKEDALLKYQKLNNGCSPKRNELISREEMIRTPPHILVTNYAMLEYLMIRPNESVFFSGNHALSWKYIIFDEAHVYHGSTGIEVSMLFSRLKATLKCQNIKYILTSATLGEKEDNKAVAEFAQKLCSAPFDETDIVRAERIIPSAQHEKDTLPINFYEKIAGLIDENRSDENILNLLGETTENNLGEYLYEKILHDNNYWKIRNNLIIPNTVKSISEKMGWSEKEVTDFVTVASRAERNGGKLFDAKYHMFLKATDSAFVTLAPDNRIMLERANAVYRANEDKYYKVFEISTCVYCGSVYLIGKIDKTSNKLEQFNYSDDIEDKEIFLLSKSVNDTDADHTLEDEGLKSEEFEICPYCGFLRKKGSTNHCEHSEEDYQKVYKVNFSSKKHSVTKCLRCENVNNTGVLRMFFSGQEASTSVIGTALFEALPSYKITVSQTKNATQSHDEFDFNEDDFGFSPDDLQVKDVSETEKVAKQFIAFSDSRQAAAFYASYLDKTYNNILYKRLINEAYKNIDAFGMNLHSFVDLLKTEFNKYGILGRSARSGDTKYNINKEAWKAVLAELIDNNGNTSLTHFGMLGIYIDIDASWASLGLGQTELSDLVSIFLTSMLADAALSTSVGLTTDDMDDITHGGVQYSYTLSDSSQSLVKSFIPTKAGLTNKRVDYFQKLLKKRGKNLTDDVVAQILTKLWNMILINEKFGILILKEHNEYRIDDKKIKIKKPKQWYICKKCQRLTCHNIDNICPTYHCDGVLESVVPEDYFKGNHYFDIYNNLEIRDLRIVEHTAQLNQATAFDYQNKFKNKEIDILSCSTTFEMGVDVGSLETVFMRNMPPLPSNYAQRAGRAGRSSKSAAFALTFCNKSSHDFSYFKDPVGMIKGKIVPPKYNVENDKIGIRHLYAAAFSKFWKIHPEYFATIGMFTTKDFRDKDGMDYLTEYLNSHPNDLKDFIKDFLPSSLCEAYKVDTFGWTDLLIGNNGILTKAVSVFNEEVRLLNQTKEEANKNNNTSLLYAMSERIRAYTSENILTFLSRKNVLPKYGFPVDTVEMTVWDKKRNDAIGLELSRDLSMAISEYAPDSQIVANNMLITSRYIKKIPNIGWKMYSFVRCNNCKTLNIQPFVQEDGKESKISECCQCHESFSGYRAEVFIVPEQGFIANKVEKPGLKKPERTYRGEMSYVGTGKGAIKDSYNIKGAIVEVACSQNDEMAVLNTSSFYVCPRCGYAEVDEEQYTMQKEKKHRTSTEHECGNTRLHRYSLGYRYLTDVVRLSFINYELNNFDVAMSVLYALLKGVCFCLNIEENDISGCLQSHFQEGRLNYSLVFFDNTPGGAGHAKRLNDRKVLEEVFEYALYSMKQCTCGGSIGDTSCYSCLRNYKNQKYHDILKREYVIDFLSEVLA